jgi:beta-mannosidase
MDLGGKWSAALTTEELRRAFPRLDFDDSSWQPVSVPGHWQSETAFAKSDGPLLYRRQFTTEPLNAGQRAWLVMEGVFYQADVWLDGSYLGDTEGYFFPHTFDVTDALLARPDHVLAVEVACDRPARRTAQRALLGVFGHWDCIDPSFNPGGIWAPVRLARTGPVRIAALRTRCREATASRAILDIRAVLDVSTTTIALLRSEVSRAGEPGPQLVTEQQQPLATGTNHVRWRLEVPNPELWWPARLGPQPLYDVEISVEVASARSDASRLRTGLRQIRMHDYIWRVNGERLFLKGANLAPTRRDLAYAAAHEVAADVHLAKEAGLDLLRVHAHIGRRELYETADELGVLIWQDLPLQWGYRGVRRQAVRQAGAAVDLLGHHPSVVAWCGHNEPMAVNPPAGGRVWPATALRIAASNLLPTWNKSVLDRSIRRALERADPSRPVIAHSGVLPHPGRSTDSHLYFGWYFGRVRDLRTALALWPALARFVSEMGAQAVPNTAGFMEPERWPELDWEGLEAHHCLQKALLSKRSGPPAHFDSFDAWRNATQAYQADLVRHQVEVLRRLKYRPTGGFAVFCLNDAQPAVSWSLLDHRRVPKAAYHALARACAPVLVMTDWRPEAWRAGNPFSAELHVVNDLRTPLRGAVLEATLRWPGGGKTWVLAAPADVPPDSCVRVGNLYANWPAELASPAGVELGLELRWEGPSGPSAAANRYTTGALGPR